MHGTIMALQWCMLKKMYYYGTYKIKYHGKFKKHGTWFWVPWCILEYHSITIEYLIFL